MLSGPVARNAIASFGFESLSVLLNLFMIVKMHVIVACYALSLAIVHIAMPACSVLVLITTATRTNVAQCRPRIAREGMKCLPASRKWIQALPWLKCYQELDIMIAMAKGNSGGAHCTPHVLHPPGRHFPPE